MSDDCGYLALPLAYREPSGPHHQVLREGDCRL